MLVFWMGMRIRHILLYQGIPMIIADSSRVALIWNMELRPDLEAMGRYFTTPIRTSMA